MPRPFTLFRGGTKQHDIDLDTYEYPGDLNVYAVLVSHPPLSDAMTRLDQEVRDLLFAIREGRPLPPMIFVPDLWHHRDQLPKQDAEKMWECVGIAVCLARDFYKTQDMGEIRNDIKGSVFCDPR